jgi:diguanylate cyclase (GGDEF)-like protein
LSVSFLKQPEIVTIDFANIIACSLISTVISYSVTCVRLTEINSNILLELACNTDELTGLHNRRSFNNFIEDVFDNPQYSRLSLMMIDIDNFKDYNDTYGHVNGDICLSQIGNVFKDFELKNDFYVSRFGGEEFVVIDYNHSIKEVEQIAKSLLQTIYNMNIENINSSYKKITISVGISHKENTNVHNYIELINLADDALYQAKNNGKNTLMIANHSLSFPDNLK